jgi:FAD/FMN-containing dehydrogenase
MAPLASDTALPITEFRGALRGTVLTPEDAGYDDARTIWNTMIDKHPALIVRCAGAADVIAAVNFARDQHLVVSVMGAGHNIAGKAVCDGGLMIDLSPMKSVLVDPFAKTARVEPGCTLAEFDHEAQAFGLATPVGYNSTTGISGLTLGGGFGWLSRKYGLTCDNLRAADVVTADGELRHASESENPDLFWALRGGGGNFGVVTSFEFDLHEVGPEVLSGPLVYPLEQAPEVLRRYREFAGQAPDEAVAWCVLRHAPPLPFLPEEWHGKPVLIIAAFYAGPMAEGEVALQPLRNIGTPIVDVIGPHPYAAWQQAFDGLLGPGARNYWKSHNFVRFTDGMIDNFIAYAESMPSPQSEIAIAHLGGAINRRSTDATAYPHRDAEFLMNLHTRWEDPAQDEKCIAWARDMYEAMTPHATGGVYVNFIPEEGGQERAAYGENYDRLVEVKNRYDPDNLFRLNQNIKPAASTG